MKGSTNKHSKLPIAIVNAEKQSKIDKANNSDASVIEDANGVRILFNGQWVGISPAMARKISADLLKSAAKADKLKADKLAGKVK